MIIDGKYYQAVYMFDLEGRVEVLKNKFRGCFPRASDERIWLYVEYAVLHICNDTCFVHCDKLMALRSRLSMHEQGKVETIALDLERVLYSMLLPIAPADVVHVDNIIIKDDGELMFCWERRQFCTQYKPMQAHKPFYIASMSRRYS